MDPEQIVVTTVERGQLVVGRIGFQAAEDAGGGRQRTRHRLDRDRGRLVACEDVGGRLEDEAAEDDRVAHASRSGPAHAGAILDLGDVAAPRKLVTEACQHTYGAPIRYDERARELHRPVRYRYWSDDPVDHFKTFEAFWRSVRFDEPR